MVSPYNKNLFSAHLVLKYADLLKINLLSDIVVSDLMTYATFTLCYDLEVVKHSKLLNKLRYLAKQEPNYNNSYIQNKQYRLVFNIPDKYRNLVLLKSVVNNKVVNDKDICNITTFGNKKAPSTVKQARLFSFLI